MTGGVRHRIGCGVTVAIGAMLGLGLLLVSGCGSAGYYAQSVGGHLELVRLARSVPDWLLDPATPEVLRERLRLTQKVRDFAVKELHLPDNASYRRYADLGRPAVVWNVVATPELSLALRTWCFAVLGCVGYRGYFDQAQATALGESLRVEGLDVNVYGVPAYSTLGWTNWLGGDPLLNTFIRWPEGQLARLIFHELAHQVAYASDDTAFNESFATAVERLGVQRWQAASGSAADDAASQRRHADFKAMTLRTRQTLEAIYASDTPDAAKRQAKAAALAAMRAEHEAAKLGPWGGISGYDAWMARANNASLSIQAAYDGLVPEFERLFAAQGSDFKRFYAEVQRLAALPKEQRRAALAAAK